MPITATQGGIRVYRHVQSTPASVWTVYHALGTKPIVEIMVDDEGVLKKAWPLEMSHVDDNTVTVRWSTARTGQATFLSHQLV